MPGECLIHLRCCAGIRHNAAFRSPGSSTYKIVCVLAPLAFCRRPRRAHSPAAPQRGLPLSLADDGPHGHVQAAFIKPGVHARQFLIYQRLEVAHNVCVGRNSMAASSATYRAWRMPMLHQTLVCNRSCWNPKHSKTISGPAIEQQQPKQHHPQLSKGTSLHHGPGWEGVVLLAPHASLTHLPAGCCSPLGAAAPRF